MKYYEQQTCPHDGVRTGLRVGEVASPWQDFFLTYLYTVVRFLLTKENLDDIINSMLLNEGELFCGRKRFSTVNQATT